MQPSKILPVVMAGFLLAGSIALMQPNMGQAEAPRGQAEQTQAAKKPWAAQKNGPWEQLHLTADQQTKMRAIRQENHQQMQALFSTLKQKHEAFAAYMGSPNAEKSKALSMQQEMNGLKGQLASLRLEGSFKQRELLNPEQRVTFAKLQQQRMQRWADWHREHRGPGGPAGHRTTSDASNDDLDE